ncbi:MAG: hypothetical protein ACTHK2_10565 [Dokdonella sp.]|uniref:hypothetical protein n=1 Tax=Dokdonella sp. TaxID=2291710 RepID=UPI003F7E5DC0
MRSLFIAARCLFLGGLLASASASASNESLSFRRTPSGSIEAVVSGMTDGCPPVFLPPESIASAATTITITSYSESGLCSLPFTPIPYSVTADLGILANQTYQVIWIQPFDVGDPLQLSAVLVPAAIGGGAAAPVPALSWWGLAVLTLMLAALSLRRTPRSRIRRAPNCQTL